MIKTSSPSCPLSQSSGHEDPRLRSVALWEEPQVQEPQECHKVFTDYQNAGLTAVGRFYVNEARVSRNGVKVGVFTYNGKFWRSTAC